MLMIILFIQLEKTATLTETLYIKNFLQKWFYKSYTVVNPGKCCYMSFGSNPDKSDLILKDPFAKIPSTEEYAILGVTKDDRLAFYNHLKNL